MVFTVAMMDQVLLIGLPVAGCMLIAFSVGQMVMDLRSNDKKRVNQRLRGQSSSDKRVRQMERSILRQTGQESHQFYDKIVGQLSFTPKVQKMLDQANIPWSATKFLFNLLCIAGLGGAVVAFIMQNYIVAAVVCGVMFLLPLWMLNFIRKRRITKFVNQLPEVFELIGQALKAGHSLGSGVQLVGDQVPDPAGGEFARVFYEQNLGLKIEDALRNLGDRIDALEARMFVTSVLIQRQTGGDLAEVLDKIGKVIRDRIEVLGQVKALTAEGRMSGWVLCALPVLVFFVSISINPDYAGMLIHEKEGRMMLIAAGVFQVMGMLMIRKIVNIKI